VHSVRSQDITIDELSIKSQDPGDGHHFGSLLALAFGRAGSSSENDLRFVRSVCGELSNSEPFEATIIKHNEDDNAQEELKVRLDSLSGTDGSCGLGVGAIAFPSYQSLVASDCDQLSPSVVEMTLSDPGLVVWDGDLDFDAIHGLAYFGFVEFVRFEFLPPESMETAVEFISSSFEVLAFGIWSNVLINLALSVPPTSAPGRFRPMPALDSKIISKSSRIFSVFGDKSLRLLHRGSREGFRAKAFDSHCDGDPNTVSFIFHDSESPQSSASNFQPNGGSSWHL
jgi:hypothetical protein